MIHMKSMNEYNSDSLQLKLDYIKDLIDEIEDIALSRNPTYLDLKSDRIILIIRCVFMDQESLDGVVGRMEYLKDIGILDLITLDIVSYPVSAEEISFDRNGSPIPSGEAISFINHDINNFMEDLYLIRDKKYPLYLNLYMEVF